MMERVKFADLDEKIKMDRCSILFSVSPEKNPDNEIDGQFENILEKIDSLPEEIKDKFFSYKIGSVILEIGKKFNLQLLQMADISRAIRSYYFGEIKLEDMPAVLAREIPIDLAKAQEISRMVIQKIINDTSVEQATQAKLAQMTVADALKAYPEVGEQLITSEKIVLKNFPDPVRPCLKNWLADFTFTLGRDKHTAMDRGIYLFQSANGKRLNSQDRNKLAYILKAFDENLPVAINKDTKQIVFGPSPQPSPYQGEGDRRPSEQASRPLPSSAPSPIPSSAPSLVAPRHPLPKLGEEHNEGLRSGDIHSTMRFSSPQKLPYEKIYPIKSPLERGAENPQFNRAGPQPYIIRPMSMEDKEEEDRPLPKNVVNLKNN